MYVRHFVTVYYFDISSVEFDSSPSSGIVSLAFLVEYLVAVLVVAYYFSNSAVEEVAFGIYVILFSNLRSLAVLNDFAGCVPLIVGYRELTAVERRKRHIVSLSVVYDLSIYAYFLTETDFYRILLSTEIVHFDLIGSSHNKVVLERSSAERELYVVVAYAGHIVLSALFIEVSIGFDIYRLSLVV